MKVGRMEVDKDSEIEKNRIIVISSKQVQTNRSAKKCKEEMPNVEPPQAKATTSSLKRRSSQNNNTVEAQGKSTRPESS
jgi:hypothetical protein